MKNKIIAILFFALSCSAKNEDNLIIRPLFPYEISGISWGTDSSKYRYYYMENYRGYDKDSSIIDEFIRNSIDSNYQFYSNYSICFYEKSYLLNENYRNPSTDRIYQQKAGLEFEWAEGDFIHAVDFKDSEKGKWYKKLGSRIFNSKIGGVTDSSKDTTFKVILGPSEKVK